MATMEDLCPRLGVNIDHVATLRQQRGTPYPSLLEAARIVESAGGRQITVHLREDRRHIQDEDVKLLRKSLKVPMNLEMAVTDEMIRFACEIRPEWVCLVPEKREELTTEGGLNIEKGRTKIAAAIETLHQAGVKVSPFIEPSVSDVRLCKELGSDAVEIHTGTYCLATQAAFGIDSDHRAKSEMERIREAALESRKLGLHTHAGHGLDYQNTRALVELLDESKRPLFEEFNIGHSIVCRAVIVGMERAVREMVALIEAP